MFQKKTAQSLQHNNFATARYRVEMFRKKLLTW